MLLLVLLVLPASGSHCCCHVASPRSGGVVLLEAAAAVLATVAAPPRRTLRPPPCSTVSWVCRVRMCVECVGFVEGPQARGGFREPAACSCCRMFSTRPPPPQLRRYSTLSAAGLSAAGMETGIRKSGDRGPCSFFSAVGPRSKGRVPGGALEEVWSRLESGFGSAADRGPIWNRRGLGPMRGWRPRDRANP